ncbi:MAG: hypothetical protein NTZ05_12270 [Chloroflexi bacterium]|nr:hypothetical protein [Chloroflexota bacterium]
MTRGGIAAASGKGGVVWSFKSCRRCGRGDMYRNPGEDFWNCLSCSHEAPDAAGRPLGAVQPAAVLMKEAA